MTEITDSRCPHCGKVIKEIHQMISPVEVLRAKRGELNLGAYPVVGKSQAEIMRQMQNRQILSNYITEMENQGWRYKGMLLYNQLPYGGNMVFARVLNEDEVMDIPQLAHTQDSDESIEYDGGEQEKIYKRLRAIRQSKRTTEEAPQKKTPKPTLTKEQREAFAKASDETLSYVKIVPEEVETEFEKKLKQLQEVEELKAKDGMPPIFPDRKEETEEPKEYPAIPPKPKPETKFSHQKVVDLVAEFEALHPGKKAIAFGKESKLFTDWKEGYLEKIRRQSR